MWGLESLLELVCWVSGAVSEHQYKSSFYPEPTPSPDPLLHKDKAASSLQQYWGVVTGHQSDRKRAGPHREHTIPLEKGASWNKHKSRGLSVVASLQIVFKHRTEHPMWE